MNHRSKKIIPPEVLISGYSRGIFPMSESRDDTSCQWYSARRRGVIPMDRFKVSDNVMRLIRGERYQVQVDQRFREVMEACADRPTTWISSLLIDSYELFHEMGYAHSVEMIDREGGLTGGLYGVSLGSAFFGESMFRRGKEADKVALWHCHRILVENGFTLWDTQYYTDHLSQFGCVEISAEEYRERLEAALRKEAIFKPLD